MERIPSLLRLNGSEESRKKGLVAFSLDDGPNSENLLKVLEILRKNAARATFFWIVEQAKKFSEENTNNFQEAVAAIKADGHEIGLHAPRDYQPSAFSRIYGKFSKSEMKEAAKELEALTGQSVSLYRPHYLLQPATIIFARQLGLTTVLGNFIHYAQPNAEVTAQVQRFSSAEAGNILIFHDGVTDARKTSSITQVLPEVIEKLKSKGLSITRVSNVL